MRDQSQALNIMKREYELTVIFTPVLKEKGMSSAVASVEELVKKYKGKVLEMTDEGKQRFAYSIQKYVEGIYLFWKLEMPASTVIDFEKELKLKKGVLRQLLVRVDE